MQESIYKHLNTVFMLIAWKNWGHVNTSGCIVLCSIRSLEGVEGVNSGSEKEHNRVEMKEVIYSDDLFIRTRLFQVDISGLTSFLEYWITH